MKVLGLTGSIGMGKSTAARMLRRLGVPVCDSDAVVHGLMARGGAAVPAIAAAFPGVVVDGAVDRRALGARVFGDPGALKRLEAILHPMVWREQGRFLRRMAARRFPVVAFDIPLLFETGADRRVDEVIVVTAPPAVQRARVLARPDMTQETFARIMARQTPDSEKRRRADHVVPTGLGKRAALVALLEIITEAKRTEGRIWPPRTGYRRGPRHA